MYGTHSIGLTLKQENIHMGYGVHLIGYGNHMRDIRWTLDDCCRAGGEAIRILGYWVDPAYAGGEAQNVDHLIQRIQEHGLDESERLFLALMNVQARRRLITAFGDAARFARLIHPSCVVAQSASIGPGSLVQAGSSVSPGVTIGAHVIINLHSLIGHGAVIEDNVVISTGVSVLGDTHIAEDAMIGASATILNGVMVGKGAFVAAGSLVNQDVKENGYVMGVPAKPVDIPTWMKDERFK